MAAKPTYRIAVAGNPNSGKTTLFNALTGSNQKVGNYPGVTVEKKEGLRHLDDATLHFVDLPGTYSLTTFSLDEVVARDYILEASPDVILDVVDASNLERNLYLAIQLAEIGKPLVIALNMIDVAEQRGMKIDTEALSARFGVPVISTVGTRRESADKLLRVLQAAASGATVATPRPVSYGPTVEPLVEQLGARLLADEKMTMNGQARWLSLKLLEGDERAHQRVSGMVSDWPGLRAAVAAAGCQVESIEDEDVATIIAEQRYARAAELARAACVSGDRRVTLTDRIDRVLCHRILGLLSVGAVVYLTFALTFQLADGLNWVPWIGGWTTPVGVFAWFFDDFLTGLVMGLPEGPLKSLVIDGVIAGVGGVIGFVPIIFFMFLILAIIEDSGYVARIAFVLDRLLRSFGLQGKSILAMIVSGGIAGGCAVPGVMATRTLNDPKDRLTTMLVVPFMNCGAKIPVFAMLIAAFFAAYKGLMMWVLVVMAWSVALTAALVLRKSLIRGAESPFVMELPAYHLPTLSGIFRNAGMRSWSYMQKAGTVILAVSVVMWAMMYFPRVDQAPFEAERVAAQEAAAEGDETALAERLVEIDNEASAAQLRQSVAGRIGQTLAPVTRFAGFDWRDNIALTGGFAAKEIIVSTMGTAYTMGAVEPVETVDDNASDNPLAQMIRQDPSWSPLRAFALMIFVMVYSPCLVTTTVILKESGSWKWTLFSTCYTTTLAFILATLVFQLGSLLGIGV